VLVWAAVNAAAHCYWARMCCRQASHYLLVPEFCPGGPRQRLTVNKSILLVQYYCKNESKPIESQDLLRRPCIQQNSLFVAA